MSYTPGPWNAGGSEFTTATWVEVGNGSNTSRICNMRACEEDWSNALIIAAAPDLLAATKAFSDAYTFISENAPAPLMHAVKKARAAIAKAEGRT